MISFEARTIENGYLHLYKNKWLRLKPENIYGWYEPGWICPICKIKYGADDKKIRLVKRDGFYRISCPICLVEMNKEEVKKNFYTFQSDDGCRFNNRQNTKLFYKIEVR